ncbi:hypothetical protein SUGI_0850950 [Cryptomeria japonica]|nr:hypothetical protein SUGI_0850950 [Cryptomeria japonica]
MATSGKTSLAPAPERVWAPSPERGWAPSPEKFEAQEIYFRVSDFYDDNVSGGHVGDPIEIPSDRKEREKAYRILLNDFWMIHNCRIMLCVVVANLMPKMANRGQAVEDAVLRSWIVARAYSPEYIIPRSALASSAAFIVTLQIVITIVGGVKCLFIFIGWLIITWRWATAVAYYRKWQLDSRPSGFRIEDVWIRHLRELQQAQEPQLPQAEVLDNKIRKVVAKEKITFTVPRKLLYAVIALQWLTVTFSKACWLASLMIFHNKLMRKLLSKLFSNHEKHAFKHYSEYQKELKGLQMLGETRKRLWLTNRKSIVKAKKVIFQGHDDTEYLCEHLVHFLAMKRTPNGLGRRCLEPYKPQTELKYLSVKCFKYLCKRRPIQRTQPKKEASDVGKQQSEEEENGLLAVEEHFTDVSTKSWKMTAVSLLIIIVELSPIYATFDNECCSTSHAFPPKAVKDCMEAYSQAWEIIDFVEETDTDADGITGQAADRTYFDILQRKLKEEPTFASNSNQATP